MKLFYSPLASQMGFAICKGGKYHDDSCYNAPEVLTGNPNMKSDVWSLGISLLEMANRRSSIGEIVEERINQCVSALNNDWPIAFVDFLKKCLVWDVNERWNVRELMNVGFSWLVDE